MVRDFLNGKRLDQILIALPAWRPETPTKPVSFKEGSAVFAMAAPIGISSWIRLVTEEKTGVRWFVSDDGENFSDIRPGEELGRFGGKPRTLKVLLSAINGEKQLLEPPALEYEHDEKAFNILRSNTAGVAEENWKPLGGHIPMNWSNGEYAAK